MSTAEAKEKIVKMLSASAVQDAHRIIMWVEAAAFHEKLFEKNREQYSPKMDERLPLGLQLAGAAFAEGKLLAVARWCEKVLDVHLSPPMERFA